MHHDTYTVSRSGESWILQVNNQELASFADQEQALRAASAAARISERRGRVAAIQVAPDGGGSDELS